MNLSIFLFEYKHFIRNKAKLFSYIFFMLLCIFSIYNGFEIMHKQINTITEIKDKQELEFNKIIEWFENEKGPDDKPWVDIEDPYWSIRYTPSYVVKMPSVLFPLGIGQSEQFGFYKKVNRWSSSFDTDMVEEISNYERLINGNIDFSFLIIFLLPILLIILTYNINGLEKDLNFNKLISIQNKRKNSWIFSRLLFYLFLLIFSVDILILGVGFFNEAFSNIASIMKIVVLSNLYIISCSFIFYFINKHAISSSSVAFKMISIWLLFCVIIPGSVHQYVSMKYPANYMTDFLDVNRKQTYEVFKLDNIDLYDFLIEIHPELVETNKSDEETLDNQLIRRSVSSIINQMNIAAADEIEIQNDDKNNLIKSSYFFNPVSYVQNLWNSYTSTDYNAYKNFRLDIEKSVIARNKLIVLELWKENKVDAETYNRYLETLNNL
jgi:ABC-2 type transport system permease protein